MFLLYHSVYEIFFTALSNFPEIFQILISKFCLIFLEILVLYVVFARMGDDRERSAIFSHRRRPETPRDNT